MRWSEKRDNKLYGNGQRRRHQCGGMAAARSRNYRSFRYRRGHGHRHLPLDIKLSDKSRYINLGEWIHHNTYAVFDGVNLELKKYK